MRDGKQTLALLTAAQQHWSYTHVFQSASTEASAIATAQAELHRELSGLGTSLADGHSVLLLAAGAAASGKTLTLVGEPEKSGAAGVFFTRETDDDEVAAASAGNPSGGDVGAKRGPRKGKGKGGGGAASAAATDVESGGGGGIAEKICPLAGLLPRLVAEAFATLSHRSSQCAFTVTVSAAAVSIPAAPTTLNDALVECLLSPATHGEGGGGSSELSATNPAQPPPPEGGQLWGCAIPAISPQEVVAIVEAARIRAIASPNSTPGSGASKRHFLSKIRVELQNHSTNELSCCEMILAELAEERPGDAWPVGLADAIRAHATATVVRSDDGEGPTGPRGNPLLAMVRSCLSGTAKVGY